MAGMQGRAKRTPANAPEPEKTVDWLNVIGLDETRGILLSGKGSPERREFLEFAESDLSHVVGRLLTEENVKFLLDLLPYALEDTKRSDIVERASKVTLLAYLWLLGGETSDELRDRVREVLHKIIAQSHPTSTRLAALNTLFCLVSLAPQPSKKEITDILEKIVLPPIEKAGKDLLDGVEEEEQDEEAQKEATAYLASLIRLLASSLGFIERKKLHEILDWCFDALVVLLEQHQDVDVKVAAAEAAVAALDLVSRYEELDWDRINSKDLVSALHGVLRDEDWGSDEERWSWKHTVEELVSMVDSEDYVVELPFITAKGQTHVYTKETLKANRGVLFNHRNKKGKAVAGWSDAVCIKYVREILGYTFSELSSIGEVGSKLSNDLRDQDGFGHAFLNILVRHPAAEGFAEHVRALRDYGTKTRITASNVRTREGKNRDLVRAELS